MSDFDALLTAVQTNADLAEFIDRLRQDLVDHATLWENPTLERYLDALAACTRNLDGFFRNTGKVMPTGVHWRIFTQVLLTARIYE